MDDTVAPPVDTHADELGYAGDITADATWALLRADPAAVLVDVRTHAERTYVGAPVLPGREVTHVEWTGFPDGAANPDFLAELAGAAGPEAPVAFLCRSGVRSVAAARAATAAGYARALNVLDGFEGPPDADGHRGTTAGWKADGLAWRQS